MDKQKQAGFGVLEVAIVLAVLLSLGFSGWYLFSRHTHVSAPKSAARTPMTKALDVALKTYDMYDTTGVDAVKSRLSDELYVKVIHNDTGHDVLTCGQMSALKNTGNNPLNRVSFISQDEHSLVAQIEQLSSDGYPGDPGSSYYYSVGPTVTIDKASLKLLAVDCPQ